MTQSFHNDDEALTRYVYTIIKYFTLHIQNVGNRVSKHMKIGQVLNIIFPFVVIFSSSMSSEPEPLNKCNEENGSVVLTTMSKL